jgi:hypothetical protein
MPTPEEILIEHAERIEARFGERLDRLENDVRSVKQELERRLHRWERMVIGIAIAFLGGAGALLVAGAIQVAKQEATTVARVEFDRFANKNADILNNTIKHTEETLKEALRTTREAFQTASNAKAAYEGNNLLYGIAKKEIDNIVDRANGPEISELRKLNRLFAGRIDELAKKLSTDSQLDEAVIRHLKALPDGELFVFRGDCPKGWDVEEKWGANKVLCARGGQ